MGKLLPGIAALAFLLLIGRISDATLKEVEEARWRAQRARSEAERIRRKADYNANRAWYDKLWDGY